MSSVLWCVMSRRMRIIVRAHSIPIGVLVYTLHYARIC